MKTALVNGVEVAATDAVEFGNATCPSCGRPVYMVGDGFTHDAPMKVNVTVTTTISEAPAKKPLSYTGARGLPRGRTHDLGEDEPPQSPIKRPTPNTRAPV